MAKKKTPPKKEKWYKNEKTQIIIVVPIVLSLPILTFLYFWYVVLLSNHPSIDECIASIPTTSGDYRVIKKIVEICQGRQEVFFWPKALWWTVLVWAPIIGFFANILDDEGYVSGIATAVGIFVGTLVGGWILVVFIGMLLGAAYF